MYSAAPLLLSGEKKKAWLRSRELKTAQQAHDMIRMPKKGKAESPSEERCLEIEQH